MYMVYRLSKHASQALAFRPDALLVGFRELVACQIRLFQKIVLDDPEIAFLLAGPDHAEHIADVDTIHRAQDLVALLGHRAADPRFEILVAEVFDKARAGILGQIELEKAGREVLRITGFQHQVACVHSGCSSCFPSSEPSPVPGMPELRRLLDVGLFLLLFHAAMGRGAWP